jgi:hypothetical protein
MPHVLHDWHCQKGVAVALSIIVGLIEDSMFVQQELQVQHSLTSFLTGKVERHPFIISGLIGTNNILVQ